MNLKSSIAGSCYFLRHINPHDDVAFAPPPPHCYCFHTKLNLLAELHASGVP